MPETLATRLPIITIGGFLGSGKTTLLNRLLTDAKSKRFVVFVNDFGAINIDYDLIETVEEDRISLKNGCVCCSLNENLVAAINEFSRSDRPPDAILIEASGVADPRALESSFSLLEASGATRTDVRIYVVDVDAFGGMNYEDSELIVDHAATTDIVLLNKCDLARAEKLAEVKAVFEVSSPYASLIETAFCDVSLDLMLSSNAVDVTQATPHPHIETSLLHAKRFSQWSAQTTSLIDREKFIAFAECLPMHCIRAKGILQFADEPGRWTVFNMIGVRLSFEHLSQSQKASSQVVAIGLSNRMDLEMIEREFTKTRLLNSLVSACDFGRISANEGSAEAEGSDPTARSSKL